MRKQRAPEEEEEPMNDKDEIDLDFQHSPENKGKKSEAKQNKSEIDDDREVALDEDTD